MHRVPIKLATGLAVVAGAAGAVAPSAAQAAGPTITGAGSTLIAPLMANWAADFKARRGINVLYSAVGSGTGIAQISARTVDFGASDAPLTSDQAAACQSCVQIPWALTATVVAVNIPGVHSIRLTGPVLSDIYLGRITRWNDKRITKLQARGTHLPSTGITPVYRSDGSGDTYVITDYLSRVSGTWRGQVGNATSVSFPKGVGGKGNDGVTAVVQSTQGAIGYVSAYYAIQHHLGVAALKNRAGRYEFPNLKNIKAASKTVRHVPSNNEMHIVNPSRKAKKAYPMSTFTYAIVPTTSPNAASIRSLVKYAVSKVGQRFGPALDFQPVPKVVSKAALHTLGRIHS